MIHFVSRPVPSLLVSQDTEKLLTIIPESWQKNCYLNFKSFYEMVNFFVLDMCSEILFCSKAARKGETCSRFLESQKVASNAKSCPKVAEHDRDRSFCQCLQGFNVVLVSEIESIISLPVLLLLSPSQVYNFFFQSAKLR